MDKLIYDRIVVFNCKNKYSEILSNDKNFMSKCRTKINNQIVKESLKNFTFGLIHISKVIPYRHLHKEEFMEHMKGYIYETSSDEDENKDEEIDYEKIKINGFLLARYIGKYSLNEEDDGEEEEKNTVMRNIVMRNIVMKNIIKKMKKRKKMKIH